MKSSVFSYLHKYFPQRSFEILLRIYTRSFPLCFYRWNFLRLNKAPGCIHLHLQVLMRDTENTLPLASLFLKTRSGSLSVWLHNNLFILITELVKHPLPAKQGFLLALSLKGLRFHSKLFKLTLFLNVILNFLKFWYLGICCFLLPKEFLYSRHYRRRYNQMTFAFRLVRKQRIHNTRYHFVATHLTLFLVLLRTCLWFCKMLKNILTTRVPSTLFRGNLKTQLYFYG